MHYPASCAREWTLHWGGFCYFPWEVIPPCAISHCKEAFVVVFLFAEDKEKSCICVFMWFPSPTHQYYTCTIHKFSFSFLPLEWLHIGFCHGNSRMHAGLPVSPARASTFFPQWTVLTCISMLYLCLGCHLLPHSLRVHWTFQKQIFFFYNFL